MPLIPQCLELVHGGEAEPFPDRATTADASPMLQMTIPGLWLTFLNRAAPTDMSPEPPTMALFGNTRRA